MSSFDVKSNSESNKVSTTDTYVDILDEDVQTSNTNDGTDRKIGAPSLKYVSLFVLVLQNAGQVLLMRYATTRDQPMFIKTVAVLFNEVLKLVASLILFSIETKSIKQTLIVLRQYFIYDICDTAKVSVVSLIYTIQNFLIYVAIENLDAGTFMVTNQLKILTTALFAVLMLRKRLSVAQWCSLVILTAGVAIVQMSAQERKEETPNLSFNSSASSTIETTREGSQQAILGFISVIAASILSGFAGVYFEKNSEEN